MDKRVRNKLIKQAVEDIGGVIGIILGIAFVIGLFILCIWGIIALYDVIKNPFLYTTTAMGIFLAFIGLLKFSYVYVDSSIYCNVEYGYCEYPLLNALVPIFNNVILIGGANLILLILNWVFSNPNADISISFHSLMIEKNLSIIILTMMISGLISLFWYLIDPIGRWFDELLKDKWRWEEYFKKADMEEQNTLANEVKGEGGSSNE